MSVATGKLVEPVALNRGRADVVPFTGRWRGPRIEVDHRHWKASRIPLGWQDQSVRDFYWRRRQWIDKRNALLERRYDAAVTGQPGGLYRYLAACWTLMNPYTDWPEWWAEQSDALEFLCRKHDRPFLWKHQQWAGPPLPLDFIAELATSFALAGVLRMFSTDEAETVLPQNGEYVVDVNNLFGDSSDVGDGLIGGTAWLTATQAYDQIAAGTINGSKIWFRGGAGGSSAIYRETAQRIFGAGANNFEMRAYPGDDERPRCVWRDGNVDGFLVFQGDDVWHYQIDIECQGQGIKWEGSNQRIDNQLKYANLTGGVGDNIAPNKMQNANGWLVQGCRSVEKQTLDTGNHHEFYYIGAATGTHRNNELQAFGASAVSNSLVHHKRTGDGVTVAAQGDITFSNDVLYIDGAGSGVMEMNGSKNHDFRNNVHLSTVGDTFYGDFNADSGDPDGLQNRHIHQTAININGVNGSYNPRTQFGTGPTAGYNNDVLDSAFKCILRIMNSNEDTPYDHQTLSNWNQLVSGGSTLAWIFNQNYSDIASFRAAGASLFETGAHDQDSVADTIQHGTIDGPNPAQCDIQNTHVGSDGSPMGHDPELLGLQAIGF